MYKQEKRYYKRAFMYAFVMACILFLPFVAIDGGYFVFYGDYNAQQIPFYKTCIEAVQSGNFGWNWQTDLGVNFTGSYSFYTLGSPFFWFAALFPVSVSQYLMAPLMAVKLGLSSLFAFIYIRRFVKKAESALIGGILYAFSGFSLYNIFFNHFHEAICFFPLLLIGLEETVVNKRRGALAIAVAINAFVNYFFFIGECVFLVIYFIIRISCDKRFRIGVGDFFCLAFESVVGVLVAGILFVPSIFQVLDVPRSTNILTDSSFMFYGREQRYGLLLEAMFFPPEVAARTNMFTDANAKWSSVALYLPLFSMAGAIAFMKGARKHWGRVLLAVCLVMAFVPGLNAAFTMFNNNYYTRWFYMPTLIICLATVYALENSDKCDMKFGLKFSAVAAGVIALIVLLHPIEQELKGSEGVKTGETAVLPNIVQISPAVFVQIGIAVIFLIMLGALIRTRKRKPQQYGSTLLCMTVVGSMILGYYFVGYGRILGPYVGSYNKAVSANIHIDDREFYRMEALDEINNVNMLWDMSSLKSFTSIIPSSTFELYELLGIERSVNSDPDNEYYAFRSMARVKYLAVKSSYDEEKLSEALDELKLYEYYGQQGDYDIYINDYAFPMGFAYDRYITEEDIPSSAKSYMDKLICRAVILTEEQSEKYGHLFTRLEKSGMDGITLDGFKADAEERIAAGVASFRITDDGFAARTEYEEAELVVFSVPYDSGWSATVNGKPVTVEKVNGGLCAVYVDKGSCNVVFTYTTPGARLGVIFTIGGIALLGMYLVVIYGFMRHKPRKYVHLYDMDQVEGIKAHNAYINQLSKKIYDSPEKGEVKHRNADAIQFPDVEEKFMDMDKYDFLNVEPLIRKAHITEHDEAYHVLKELEEKQKGEIE